MADDLDEEWWKQDDGNYFRDVGPGTLSLASQKL